MSNLKYSNQQYQKLLEKIFAEIQQLAKNKGEEYSGDSDRLLNFRRNGIALGLPMETIWAVYAAKHWDAIMQYIKDLNTGISRTRTEPISGRAHDLLVYLTLFLAMEDERVNSDLPSSKR